MSKNKTAKKRPRSSHHIQAETRKSMVVARRSKDAQRRGQGYTGIWVQSAHNGRRGAPGSAAAAAMRSEKRNNTGNLQSKQTTPRGGKKYTSKLSKPPAGPKMHRKKDK